MRRDERKVFLRPFLFGLFETKIAARNGQRSTSILYKENNGLGTIYKQTRGSTCRAIDFSF